MIHSTISEKIRETPSTVTLRFKWEAKVLPGQFIMIWIPGFGEIPMSLSYLEEKKGITVKAYGTPSRKLQELSPGDTIFFMGPYGRPFSDCSGRKLIVGSGSGMASLLPLVDPSSTVIVSAKSKEELLFAGKIKAEKIITVTDDGSSGFKGFPHEYLSSTDLKGFDMAYVCGPELMMYNLLPVFRKAGINAEFSLERSMKCGIGICDSCSIDGFQLCRDGPVFDLKSLLEMEEFGKWKLDHSGKRVKV